MYPHSILMRKGGFARKTRKYLGGGSDAEAVVAAADDLGDADALQRFDGARLHRQDLCPLPLPALPVRVATPRDDVLGRDCHCVISPVASFGSQP